MYKTQRKIHKGLLGVLIAVAAVTALFIAAFIVFAAVAGGAYDPDLKDFGAVFAFHIKGVGELIAFTYGDGSLLYFALSAFLFALPVCWVIFLVAAAITAERRKRRIVLWSVGAMFLDLIIYAIVASGMVKYTKIIALEGVFEGQTLLLVLAWSIIGLGALHLVLAILSYFWSLAECYREGPTEGDNEEKPSEEPLNEETLEAKEPEKEETSTSEEKGQEGMIQNSMNVTIPKKGKGGIYLVQNFYRSQDACDEEE